MILYHKQCAQLYSPNYFLSGVDWEPMNFPIISNQPSELTQTSGWHYEHCQNPSRPERRRTSYVGKMTTLQGCHCT
jgi:hypothetical protein